MNICRIVKNGANRKNIIKTKIMYFRVEEIVNISIMAYETPM
jgi:hypothetical protein